MWTSRLPSPSTPLGDMLNGKPILNGQTTPPNDPDYSKDGYGNCCLNFEETLVRCVFDDQGHAYLIPHDVARACDFERSPNNKSRPDAYGEFITSSGRTLCTVVHLGRCVSAASYYRTEKAKRFKEFICKKFPDAISLAGLLCNKSVAADPDGLPSEEGVEFKRLPPCPSYAIGTDGSAWSCKSGVWVKLNQRKDYQGYFTVKINKIDKHVHKLVLLTFRGERPAGKQSRHLNDIKTDNRLENLAYGTPSQNQEDRRKNNPQVYDVQSNYHKLDKGKALQIRAERESGKPILRIAKDHGVHPTTVCDVISRRTWKDV